MSADMENYIKMYRVRQQKHVTTAKKLSRADILILDEFGYVPLENMSYIKIVRNADVIGSNADGSCSVTANIGHNQQTVPCTVDNNNSMAAIYIDGINQCLLIKQLPATSDSYICSNHAKTGADTKSAKYSSQNPEQIRYEYR